VKKWVLVVNVGLRAGGQLGLPSFVSISMANNSRSMLPS
jgi:hypothetical protein